MMWAPRAYKKEIAYENEEAARAAGCSDDCHGGRLWGLRERPGKEAGEEGGGETSPRVLRGAEERRDRDEPAAHEVRVGEYSDRGGPTGRRHDRAEGHRPLSRGPRSELFAGRQEHR